MKENEKGMRKVLTLADKDDRRKKSSCGRRLLSRRARLNLYDKKGEQ
jgi:hypothetical protein